MSVRAELPPEVAEKIGPFYFYFYVLVDPRSGQVFYAGKGTGTRLLAHGFEAEKLSDVQDRTKLQAIREIRAHGLEPQIDVVRWGLDETTAFHVEAALIDVLDRLTNLVRGAHAEQGRTPLKELVAQFGAPPLSDDLRPPGLLITLGDWQDGDVGFPGRAGGGYRLGMSDRELYDATRGWWKVSPKRMERSGISHAVAVHRGVTRAIFGIERWFARPEGDGRSGFDGERLWNGPIFDAYVGALGKRVPAVRGGQNPIRYWPRR